MYRRTENIRDVSKEIILPERKFEVDNDIRALWHFNESYSWLMFFDSSINNYEIRGENGSFISGPFLLDRKSKLEYMGHQ